MGNKIYPDEIKKQGWKQMNEILDRELPAENPWKKVVILFLLLLAISLPAIYFISANAKGKESIEIKVPEQPEKFKADTIKSERTANYANLKKGKQKPGDLQLTFTDKKEQHIEAEENKPMLSLSEGKNTKIIPDQIASQIILPNKQEAMPEKEIHENEKPQEYNDLPYRSHSTVYALQKSPNVDGKSFSPHPFLDIHVKNPYRSLLNPFAKLSIFNTRAKVFSPGFGLYAGNSFYFSRRFFLDLSIGYTSAESLVKTTVLADGIETDRSTYNEISLYQGDQNVITYLSRGVAEISVMEGYHFNRRFSVRAGGGVIFTGRLNKLITGMAENNQSNSDDELTIETGYGNSITISKEKLLPSHAFFASISSSYLISEQFDLLFGYKHYFRNYNIVRDKNKADIYRVYMDNPPFVSGLYIGMRYRILEK